jgi:hypothetical protein
MRHPRARSLDACGRPSTSTGQAHAAAADPQPTAAVLPPLARVPATTHARSSSSVRSMSRCDIGAQRTRRPRPAAVAPDLVHVWRCRQSSRTRSAPSPRTCAAPARSERHASRAVVEGEYKAHRRGREARVRTRRGYRGQGSLRRVPGARHHFCARRSEAQLLRANAMPAGAR